MKLFLIFSVICLAGVNGRPKVEGFDEKLRDDEKKAMAQCVRELNLDASKYTERINIDELARNPDDETTCMMACGFRHLMPKIAPGSQVGADNRETLYNGSMKLIDEAFKNPIGEVPDDISRENIVEKVERCYANEPTECGFFKCVEFNKPPYTFVVLQYFAHGFRREVKIQFDN